MPTAAEVKLQHESERLDFFRKMLVEDPTMKKKFLKDISGRVFSWSPMLAAKDGMTLVEEMPKHLIPKTNTPTSTVKQEEAEQEAEATKKAFDEAVAAGVAKAMADKEVSDAVDAQVSESTENNETGYSTLNFDDLKELCKARDIKIGNTTKPETLIAKLIDYDKEQELG